ncbi:MAG: hypothetical protein HQK54_13225 [Oligoflexales bacterium]|nr:hypothetical protein [Oligoflexales bacterium]
MKKTILVLSTILALVSMTALSRTNDHPGIFVVVTVDWEGSSLDRGDLLSMKRFRDEFPDIPLTHFINAAYYTKAGADANEITSRISGTLRDGDELGLHIHGWKSLFEAAGVKFRSVPNFWGYRGPADRYGDYGHDVPISAYTGDELRRVIGLSLKILEDAGFGRAKSFRAGGWMADGNVLSALAREGLTSDHSAVPYVFLEEETENTPLLDWVKNLWQGITDVSQPFMTNENIIEIPDNGALADYVTDREMLSVFNKAAEAFIKDKSSTKIVSIGFHEETAGQYLSRLRSAIKLIRQSAAENGVPLYFVTSKDVENIFYLNR